MESNYEPARSELAKQVLVEKLSIPETEEQQELIQAKEDSATAMGLLEAMEAYHEDHTDSGKPVHFSRQQRRKMVRDSEIRFAKQKKSFGSWASALPLDLLDFFKDSFENFADFPLPKKDMDLILRGLSPANFQRKAWSPWQTEILYKYYQRALTKKLKYKKLEK